MANQETNVQLQQLSSVDIWLHFRILSSNYLSVTLLLPP
jgi:hypothetical protein